MNALANLASSANALGEVINAAGSWLAERERTAQMRLAYRREVRMARVAMKGLRAHADQNIRFWKAQLRDRSQARKEITHNVKWMLAFCERAIEAAERLHAAGNPGLAQEMMARAESALAAATQLIHDKFPSGPLTSIS